MDWNEIKEKYPNCPNCGRHCPIDAVSCPRGQAFVEQLLRGESVEEGAIAASHGEGHARHGQHSAYSESHDFHGHGERGKSREFHEHGEHSERCGFSGHGEERGCRGRHGDGHGRGCCRREIPDDDSLGSLLHKCMHQIRHGSHRGTGQNRILRILAQTEELSQRDLQEQLGIQPGSLSEILGKLESKGQIQRSRDEQDKRKATLRITEEGRKALDATQPEQEWKDPFAALSAEEQETLRALLNKVLEADT